MNQKDIDAFVSIVKTAIDQRLTEFRKELEGAQLHHLAQVAKNAVRTDAEQIQSHLSARLDDMVKAIPVPADGKDATPEQIAAAVADYAKANPVPPPEPIAPSPEQIAKAVADYMQANPVTAPEPIAPSADQIAKAVAEHIQANPVPVPVAPAPLEPTPEQISEAVQKHIDANPVEIPAEALEGMVSDYMKANPVPTPKAPEALAPTPEQIAAGVADYIKANPIKDGDRGLDAVEINILPRIDPVRRYAKGTYAHHDGGLWHAVRDTNPGDDPAACGWDVVVRGVKAIEVHELQAGEIAIKTLLTGGESHVTKAHIPTFADTYQGVWRESFGEYAKGHTVTHKGSVWLAKEPASTKPGDSPDWQLIVKAGRDGKDLNVVKMDRPATYRLEGK
jgi:hypothetical protein